MKEIKVVLPDEYDDAVTITAVGQTMGVAHVRTNVMVQAVDLTGHDGDMFVMRPHESPEWRKPETGWIPVEERLPGSYEDVLLYGSYAEDEKPSIHYGYFDEETEKFATHSRGWHSMHEVTHWMPLPEPPEVRIWEKL